MKKFLRTSLIYIILIAIVIVAVLPRSLRFSDIVSGVNRPVCVRLPLSSLIIDISPYSSP